MRIEHVALYVSDVERAREFFVRYFGGSANALYHNETPGFRSYFISFSDGARLELMTRPDLVLQDKALHRAGLFARKQRKGRCPDRAVESGGL